MLKFIIFPLIIWLIGQSMKCIIYLLRYKKITKKKVLWIYTWASGVPSTHAAMLASSLYLLWFYNGIDATFSFAFVVSLLLVYNLLAERRKEELLEQRANKKTNKFLQAIFDDHKLLDISGHTFFEIFTGIVVGISATIIFLKIFG
ncbi:divergent PAP2 family protein [Candidatus Woesearchaeota archaeon]|nr:divergent PAP2 family protein [Candidatus Woesearchaeota archaeon]